MTEITQKDQIVKKEAPEERNLTESDRFGHILKPLEYQLASKEVANKIREQKRTTEKKALFLEFWEKSSGVILATCEKVGISRMTFYDWCDKDPEFEKGLRKITEHRNRDVEDILMAKIFFEKDGPSVRYYLERKDPTYKPKAVTEVIAGERTLEDLIAEDEAKIIKQQEEYDRQHANNSSQAEAKDKPGADREIAKNQEQEGAPGVVRTEQGTGALHENGNAPKPDIESPAKGTEQGN